MSKFALDLSDTYETIIRPISLDIIEAIKRSTGIPKNTRIIFADEGNKPINNGSSLDDSTTDAIFDHGDSINLRVSALYTPESMLTSAVYQKEHLEVFTDHKLGIHLTPVYGETELTMTVQYRAESKSAAERWQAGIKRKVAVGLKESIHDVDYHYLIPKHMLVMLVEFHELREQQAGYGEALQEYFQAHQSPKLTSLSNLAGNATTVGVRETQRGIVGYYSFDDIPELEQGESGSNWIAEFTYKVKFDRPTSMVIDYPLVIHNQLIPSKYIDLEADYNLKLSTYLAGMTRYNFNHMLENRPEVGSGISGYSIPCFDNWLPTQIIPSTTTVARILLGLSPDNLTSVMSLTEMGDFAFDDIIVEYMKDVQQKLFLSGEAALMVNLYSGELIVDSTKLSIDEDLNITVSDDLDLRNIYHVRVSIANDWSRLSAKAIDYLRSHGTLCNLLLSSLAPELEEMGLLPTPIANDYIPRLQFWNAVHHIRTTNSKYHNHLEVNRHHVAKMVVVTHSEK